MYLSLIEWRRFVRHVSDTELRQNLARHLDDAVDHRTRILVTREGGKGGVVLLSEDEFAGWQETVHLLSNPANASWLLDSLRQAEAGDMMAHELIQPPE